MVGTYYHYTVVVPLFDAFDAIPRGCGVWVHALENAIIPVLAGLPCIMPGNYIVTISAYLSYGFDVLIGFEATAKIKWCAPAYVQFRWLCRVGCKLSAG